MRPSWARLIEHDPDHWRQLFLGHQVQQHASEVLRAGQVAAESMCPVDGWVAALRMLIVVGRPNHPRANMYGPARKRSQRRTHKVLEMRALFEFRWIGTAVALGN